MKNSSYWVKENPPIPRLHQDHHGHASSSIYADFSDFHVIRTWGYEDIWEEKGEGAVVVATEIKCHSISQWKEGWCEETCFQFFAPWTLCRNISVRNSFFHKGHRGRAFQTSLLSFFSPSLLCNHYAKEGENLVKRLWSSCLCFKQCFHSCTWLKSSTYGKADSPCMWRNKGVWSGKEINKVRVRTQQVPFIQWKTGPQTIRGFLEVITQYLLAQYSSFKFWPLEVPFLDSPLQFLLLTVQVSVGWPVIGASRNQGKP